MTDDFGKSESDANLIIDGIKTKACDVMGIYEDYPFDADGFLEN